MSDDCLGYPSFRHFDIRSISISTPSDLTLTFCPSTTSATCPPRSITAMIATVFTNARIFTSTGDGSLQEALVTQGDKVVFVGDADEARGVGEMVSTAVGVACNCLGLNPSQTQNGACPRMRGLQLQVSTRLFTPSPY